MHDNVFTHDLIISVFKARTLHSIFHVDIKAILKKATSRESKVLARPRIARGVASLGPLPSLQEDKRIRILTGLNTRSFFQHTEYLSRTMFASL